MAQADRGGVARFTFRTAALVVGLVGTVLALIVVLLYTIFHVFGQVAGISNDTTHFWWGLVVVLLALSGSLLAPILPIVAAAMLAVAGIALFFIVGWWALIVSPFLLVAALMTFSNRRVNIPGVA